MHRAGLHGGDGRLDRAVAGEDDHLGVGQLALGLGQDLQPTDAVHDEVGDDDIERLFLDQPQAHAPTCSHDALVADAREALGHGIGMGFIVVNHKYTDLLVHRAELASSGEIRSRKGVLVDRIVSSTSSKSRPFASSSS